MRFGALTTHMYWVEQITPLSIPNRTVNPPDYRLAVLGLVFDTLDTGFPPRWHGPAAPGVVEPHLGEPHALTWSSPGIEDRRCAWWSVEISAPSPGLVFSPDDNASAAGRRGRPGRLLLDGGGRSAASSADSSAATSSRMDALSVRFHFRGRMEHDGKD